MNEIRSDEAVSAEEQELHWQVSEALLDVVQVIADRPHTARSAATSFATALVQRLRMLNPDRRGMAAVRPKLADELGGRIVGLAAAHDDLTTSDLQGIVEVLALRLIRNLSLVEPQGAWPEKHDRPIDNEAPVDREQL